MVAVVGIGPTSLGSSPPALAATSSFSGTGARAWSVVATRAFSVDHAADAVRIQGSASWAALVVFGEHRAGRPTPDLIALRLTAPYGCSAPDAQRVRVCPPRDLTFLTGSPAETKPGHGIRFSFPAGHYTVMLLTATGARVRAVLHADGLAAKATFGMGIPVRAGAFLDRVDGDGVLKRDGTAAVPVARGSMYFGAAWLAGVPSQTQVKRLQTCLSAGHSSNPEVVQNLSCDEGPVGGSALDPTFDERRVGSASSTSADNTSTLSLTAFYTSRIAAGTYTMRYAVAGTGERLAGGAFAFWAERP